MNPVLQNTAPSNNLGSDESYSQIKDLSDWMVLVSKLVLWAKSTTKDYIRAEHKLHFTSRLFISQVIIPQVMFLKPIYIPRALNTGTYIQQGDVTYFILRAYTGTGVSHSKQEKLGRGFGKNAGKWTGRV